MWALSIWQPWAWLIVKGYKPLENRFWRSSYRGPLLIHASKKADELSLAEIARHYGVEIPGAERLSLPRGGIVGRVDMTGCLDRSGAGRAGNVDLSTRPTKDGGRVLTAELDPGLAGWFQGPYAFRFENPVELPFWACRGRQGFFKLDYPGGSV